MPLIRDQIRQQLRVDGGDHVNLSIHGKTQIGQNASPEMRKRFYIPHLGEFDSPRCFANWMVSCGDDALRFSHARYNIRDTPLNLFRLYMLYAKYFQIVAIRGTYASKRNLVELPWVMYKQHLTGVREYDRWEAYSKAIKTMVEHVINNDANAKFDWAQVNAKIPQVVEARIREIAVASGTAAEDVVGLTETDDVAKQRKAAQRISRRREVPPAMAPVQVPEEPVNPSPLARAAVPETADQAPAAASAEASADSAAESA